MELRSQSSTRSHPEGWATEIRTSRAQAAHKPRTTPAQGNVLPYKIRGMQGALASKARRGPHASQDGAVLGSEEHKKGRFC